MTGTVRELAGVRAFVCADDGPLLGSERDVTDLIGETFRADPALIAIPVARLSPDFFQLRTRLAGEMLQKFVNYRRQVAIVGDIAAAVDASDALRDFVRESNRGSSVWFVADLESLEQRLAGGT